jgi:hypothetical protein
MLSVSFQLAKAHPLQAKIRFRQDAHRCTWWQSTTARASSLSPKDNEIRSWLITTAGTVSLQCAAHLPAKLVAKACGCGVRRDRGAQAAWARRGVSRGRRRRRHGRDPPPARTTYGIVGGARKICRPCPWVARARRRIGLETSGHAGMACAHVPPVDDDARAARVARGHRPRAAHARKPPHHTASESVQQGWTTLKFGRGRERTMSVGSLAVAVMADGDGSVAY